MRPKQRSCSGRFCVWGTCSCRRNPVRRAAVPGWLRLGRSIARRMRGLRSRTGTGRLRRGGGQIGRAANGMQARVGGAKAGGGRGSWMRNLCAECVRIIQSSWRRWRTMWCRTGMTMGCSGSGRCSRCASLVMTARNSGPSGAQVGWGGLESPGPPDVKPAGVIRFFRAQI